MFLGVLDRYFNMLSREFFRFWKFSFFVISEPKNYPPQKNLSQLFTFVINVIFSALGKDRKTWSPHGSKSPSTCGSPRNMKSRKTRKQQIHAAERKWLLPILEENKRASHDVKKRDGQTNWLPWTEILPSASGEQSQDENLKHIKNLRAILTVSVWFPSTVWKCDSRQH